MPVAACDKCVVTTGLFILLQATGHGLDPLPGVSDLDIYNWPEDHVRLRCAVTKTQKSLQKISDTSFLRRLERCTDAHLQRGCLNCPLASKFVGIAATPTGKNRKRYIARRTAPRIAEPCRDGRGGRKARQLWRAGRARQLWRAGWARRLGWAGRARRLCRSGRERELWRAGRARQPWRVGRVRRLWRAGRARRFRRAGQL